MLDGMSVQIAVRLADEDLRRLDALVAQGVFPSRAAAMRLGLDRLLHEDRERQIAAAYLRAYAEREPDEDARRVGDAGLTLGAQLLVGESSAGA